MQNINPKFQRRSEEKSRGTFRSPIMIWTWLHLLWLKCRVELKLPFHVIVVVAVDRLDFSRGGLRSRRSLLPPTLSSSIIEFSLKKKFVNLILKTKICAKCWGFYSYLVDHLRPCLPFSEAARSKNKSRVLPTQTIIAWRGFLTKTQRPTIESPKGF